MSESRFDLTLKFGPQNRFTLYVPVTQKEQSAVLQQLAQTLLTAFAPAAKPKQEAQRQMAFAWAQPTCGSFEQQQKLS